MCELGPDHDENCGKDSIKPERADGEKGREFWRVNPQIPTNAAVTINPVAEWVNPWRLLVTHPARHNCSWSILRTAHGFKAAPRCRNRQEWRKEQVESAAADEPPAS